MSRKNGSCDRCGIQGLPLEKAIGGDHCPICRSYGRVYDADWHNPVFRVLVGALPVLWKELFHIRELLAKREIRSWRPKTAHTQNDVESAGEFVDPKKPRRKPRGKR